MADIAQSIFRGEIPHDITEKYELLNVLGAGTFGVVSKCRCKESDEVFAVKTIKKTKVPDLGILKREIDILQQVDHPHIIKLYDVYENDEVRNNAWVGNCSKGRVSCVSPTADVSWILFEGGVFLVCLQQLT